MKTQEEIEEIKDAKEMFYIILSLVGGAIALGIILFLVFFTGIN